MALSLDTSGFNVSVPTGNAPLTALQPITLPGAVQTQIKPLAGWSTPSSHPELVAQGIAQGVGAIAQGVQVAYQSRRQELKDALAAKKEEDRFQQQQRTEELRQKQLDNQMTLGLARIEGTRPQQEAVQDQRAEAAEVHEMLNQDTTTTTPTSPETPPLREPQFQRDVQPLGRNEQLPSWEQQSKNLVAMTIPGMEEARATFQPGPTLAQIQPPPIEPGKDYSTENKYMAASTIPAPVPINRGADSYTAATAMPSPQVSPTPAPTPAPTPTPETTAGKQLMPGMTSLSTMITSGAPAPSATPAPAEAVQAPAPPKPPAPTPQLDTSKDYSNISQIKEAFQKIKAPDTTVYQMPQYSAFTSPRDAALYAAKFSNPDYKAAKITPVPDKNGLFHITWQNIREQRLKAEQADAEHQTRHLEVAERLGRMDEAGIKAQVDDFNADPQLKLMNTRAQQIPAFFNVSQMALSGDPHKSRRVTDLDAIDSFVAFARGTQPTESQYSEIQNYTQGFLADLRQKIDKGVAGARLSPDDIQTMRSLMVENYNNNANLLNPDIRALRDNYVQKHPQYRPEELPIEFKPLLTQEYMNNEIENAQRDMRQLQSGIKWASDHNKPQLHAQLMGQYEKAKAKQFAFDEQLAEATASGGMPINWSDWTHSRRGGWMRGMHGGVPDTATLPTAQ